MAKILVVDDEKNIRDIINKYATYEGYEVEEASDGRESVQLCLNNHYDIIIMDIMMQDMDGYTAVKEIRTKSNIPVIMLSARGEEYDKLYGFDLGIDDYVVKPFSCKELMMRVKAILKRVEAKTNTDIVKIDGLEIDFTAHKVLINKEEISLSPKEYELLFFFVKNEGIALTREVLINQVWGYDFYGDDRTLDTHIKLLRRSLKDYSSLIVTLRGVGYRFEGENK
ncbi:MAG: response regulator transcription factor [Erysipelotrichaceae bacterium]